MEYQFEEFEQIDLEAESMTAATEPASDNTSFIQNHLPIILISTLLFLVTFGVIIAPAALSRSVVAPDLGSNGPPPLAALPPVAPAASPNVLYAQTNLFQQTVNVSVNPAPTIINLHRVYVRPPIIRPYPLIVRTPYFIPRPIPRGPFYR